MESFVFIGYNVSNVVPARAVSTDFQGLLRRIWFFEAGKGLRPHACLPSDDQDVRGTSDRKLLLGVLAQEFGGVVGGGFAEPKTALAFGAGPEFSDIEWRIYFFLASFGGGGWKARMILRSALFSIL